MHLIPKSKLYGRPAPMVCDFLREVIGMQVFDTEDLRGWLEVSAEETDAVVTVLLADGYTEHATPRGSVLQYRLTDKGTQLGLGQR